ncbi:tryptophan 2,3-dioxygenase [Amycolatopsis pigmentata]|uniref:Tryptophan 2,3-dioxygenase n=1 Tax=Amycolatopsis pigmentata TaxID=450801 RepID=A0ABW5FRE9_9PSEU
MDTSFAEYVGVQTLRAATSPLTSAAAEPSFLMSAQVMEILFDLAFIEARAARDAFDNDDTHTGLRALTRVRQTQSVLLTCWQLLRGMTPGDYAEFRDAFGSASGFQSAAYRRFEFMLGKKDAHLLDRHRDQPEVYAELVGVHRDHSLPDAVTGLLRRRMAWSWRQVYRNPAHHPDLFDIGQALADIADNFTRWRSEHLVVVERVLGTQPGTAGTSGLSWLRKAAEHRFFPELHALG